MRLTYSGHAWHRAKERGLPVFRQLPRSATLVKVDARHNPGPHCGTLVSEYRLWCYRTVLLMDKSRDASRSPKKLRRRSEARLLVREDLMVLTCYWLYDEEIVWKATHAHDQALLRRRKRDYAEQDEVDAMTDDCYAEEL